MQKNVEVRQKNSQLNRHALQTKSKTKEHTPLLGILRMKTQPTYSLFTVTDGHKKNNGPFVVSVLVNSTPLCLEVDTGAAITIISKDTYHHALSDTPPLEPSSRILRTYTGEQLNVLGVLKVNIQYQSQTADLELTVVEGSGPSLLGRDWLQVLTLD